MEKGIKCCFSASAPNAYIYLIAVAIALILIRVSYVIYWSSRPLCTTSPQPLGGHTTKLLNLLSVLHTDRFAPRFYVAAATANMSLQKARLFENCLMDKRIAELIENKLETRSPGAKVLFMASKSQYEETWYGAHFEEKIFHLNPSPSQGPPEFNLDTTF